MKTRMLTSTSLYAEAQRRLSELKNVRTILEQEIKKSPPGKIHIVIQPKRTQFYIRMNPADKSGIYLSKSQTSLLKQHLQKKYDIGVMKLMDSEIARLERFLKTSADGILGIRGMYSNYPPEIRSYLEPVDVSDNHYAEQWLQKPYERKEIEENLPVFLTERGEHVRSKSEIMIANALLHFGIPYKYECPLCLKGGQVIHPDFTILLVNQRRELYWEHRGMMDDRNYANHAVQRVKDYTDSGFMLGRDLILTEETSRYPLGTADIQAVIASLLRQ